MFSNVYHLYFTSPAGYSLSMLTRHSLHKDLTSLLQLLKHKQTKKNNSDFCLLPPYYKLHKFQRQTRMAISNNSVKVK